MRGTDKNLFDSRDEDVHKADNRLGFRYPKKQLCDFLVERT